jgi:predicted RNA-binding protein (virulence factor B family)
MMRLGTTLTLRALRTTSVGFYLGDEDGNELLLPFKYVPKDFAVGQDIEVFVYADSEDRPIATTLRPKAQVEEFALMTVKDTGPHGAYLDWGLEKDLFLPFGEQRGRREVGEEVLVFVYNDERTGLPVASERLNTFLVKDDIRVVSGDMVDLLVTDRSDLGYNVIVNDLYQGLMYFSDVRERLQRGHRMKGNVARVRPDGKLDIRPGATGLAAMDTASETILSALRSNGGHLPLHDNSDPELISQKLHMSKKLFKKTIGSLFRKELIWLDEDGVRLR